MTEEVVSGFLALLLFALQPGLVDAKAVPTLTAEASRMDEIALTQGEARVISKLSSEFQAFLGNEARSVVVGLRNGTPIALGKAMPAASAETHPGLAIIIKPPTHKMGLGNVFISLALAKQQLGRLGIERPTPEELKGVLLGGSVTSQNGGGAATTKLQGILAMRSQGMGWGLIAQKLGLKLAPVVNALKAANQGLTAATAKTSNTRATSN